MSAFAKKIYTGIASQSREIYYHLYIQDVSDIQFVVTVQTRDTFRTIVNKAIKGILKLQPDAHAHLTVEQCTSYHDLARSFPSEYLTGFQDSHPFLYLKIAKKMTHEMNENGYDIATYALELLRENQSSISLNARLYEKVLPADSSLFIMFIKPQYPLSCISTSTNSNISPTSFNSFNSFHSADSTNNNNRNIMLHDTNTNTHTHMNTHNNNQNQNHNHNHNRNVNKKKIKPKKKLKKRKNKPKPKPKAKAKPQKKNKKRKRKVNRKDRNYHNKNHNNISEMSDDEFDEWDFSSEYETEEEDELDMFSDDMIINKKKKVFHPPIKRRKVNRKKVKRNLRQKNPNRNNNMILSQLGPMRPLHPSRISHMIPRHRQVSRVAYNNRNKNKNKKRLTNKESKPNHLIILLDNSRSMASSLIYQKSVDDETVSRYEMAIKYTRKYLQNTWKDEDQKQTVISFATFGRGLDIKANTLPYSPRNVSHLVKMLLNLKKQNDVLDNLDTESAVYDAMHDLIEAVKMRKIKKYKNTRVLIFTDGENWSVKPDVKLIQSALKIKKISIDCIQTTRSERDNVTIRKICTSYSHHGRFWNPLTLADWDDIFLSYDFLFPYLRDRVLNLTNMTSDDSDDDQ